ncbi:50S ribosomal protein L29 [Candidatus Poribacteria bacterium]|nr:50S ribosomal protein L29 [Candidatus Poribacteria bacterium]
MRVRAEAIGVGSMDELRQKTPTELKTDLKTLRGLGVDMKFQRVYGQLEDSTKPRLNRQNIARVLTVVREKQIQQFLLTDEEVAKQLEAGVTLSAGKNDPPSRIGRDDLAGSDARSATLAMRLWARMRKNPDFFRRTQNIAKV